MPQVAPARLEWVNYLAEGWVNCLAENPLPWVNYLAEGWVNYLAESASKWVNCLAVDTLHTGQVF